MTDFNDFRFDDVATRLPLVDISSFTPTTLGGDTDRQPIIVNQPRAQRSIENKYAGYMQELQGQYNPRIINAMMAYDADRVARGQAPLSEEQTRRALETAQQGEAQTPEGQRSLLNVPGNALSNIGDIVRGIPRLPAALINEVTSLGDIGESISSAPNPIAGMAGAPGVRLLPGAYVVENLAKGTPSELLRNPVFTALDILPLANQAAKGTTLARTARESSEAVARGEAQVSAREAARLAKMERRPLSAVMTNKFDVDGNIVRNNFGQFIDEATESRMIRPLKQWFSTGERDVMYAVNAAGQRVHNVVTGTQLPKGQLDELSRDAFKLREDLLKMDPDIEARLPDITKRLYTGNYDGLSATDMRALEMYRDLMGRVTEWSVRNNYHVMFQGEVYDLKSGVRLGRARQRVDDIDQVSSIRQRVITGDADPIDVLSKLRDIHRRPRRDVAFGQKRTDAQRAAETNSGVVTSSMINTSRQAAIRALKGAGYDISVLQDEAGRLLKGDAFWSAVDGVIDGTYQLPKRDLMSYAQILETIQANKGMFDGTSLAVLDRGIRKGEWKVVSEALQSLRKQKGAPALNDPVFVDSVRQLRDNARFLEKTKVFSDDALVKAQRKLDEAVNESPPARFIPEIERRTREGTKQFLIDNLDADPDLIASLADRGMWSSIPGFEESMYRRVQRETAASWQHMRDQGFNPEFVHTVPVNRVNRVFYPAEGVIPRNPSSINKRMLDMTPGMDDFTIAVSDQMIEYLTRREVETAIKYVMDLKGETEAALRERFYPMAQARAARAPVKTVEGHLQDIMSERFRPFDPMTEGYNWGSPYLNRLAQDRMWIPQSTYANLKSLADPKSIAGGLFDPTTKAFRIAVVGLSLRTQIYNIVGGAVSAELQRPGVLLRQAGKIREYLNAERIKSPRTTDAPQFIRDSPELMEMIGSQKQMMMQLDDIPAGRVTEGVTNYLKGKKLRQWWDDAQARKQEGRPLNKFSGKISGLTEKMYDLNGVFDDMYRMATYFDEYETSLRKGFTNEAAAQRAIGQTRRVLQDWMGMTPMERSVMRSLVPFYGFMSYAMRYVMAFPFDHPLRAEMITKLSLAEMEDLDALPSRFMANWFIGGMGPAGEQGALNLGPVNPYGDIANMMTISGFLGATNPAISTMFQMVGLDQGEAELYPSLRYDPETGRLAAKSGNPVLTLLENTIPQSGLITALTGMNDQFNETLARDPAAANRFLLSTLTVPILWRQYNVPQEQFKAEVARMETEETVLNQALKTGDWSEALRYPSLAQYLSALDSMTDAELAAFRPGANDPAQLAQNALAGGGPVVPSTPALDDLVTARIEGAVLGGQGSGAAGQSAPGVPLPSSTLANTSVGGI